MAVRLRGKTGGTGRRHALRTLAAAGLAGAAALARAPRAAEAGYIYGTTEDVVDHDLRVKGNLVVEGTWGTFGWQLNATQLLSAGSYLQLGGPAERYPSQYWQMAVGSSGNMWGGWGTGKLVLGSQQNGGIGLWASPLSMAAWYGPGQATGVMMGYGDQTPPNFGAIVFGNFGVGTATPLVKAHVAGSILSGLFAIGTGGDAVQATGANAGIAFAKRSLTSWPGTPRAGDSFVLYADDAGGGDSRGKARLATSGVDLLTVNADGKVGIVAGGEVRIGGTLIADQTGVFYAP